MGVKGFTNTIIALGFFFICVVIFTKSSSLITAMGVLFGFILVVVGYMVKGPLRKRFESEQDVTSYEEY